MRIHAAAAEAGWGPRHWRWCLHTFRDRSHVPVFAALSQCLHAASQGLPPASASCSQKGWEGSYYGKPGKGGGNEGVTINIGSYYGKSGEGGGNEGVTINIGDSLLHALAGARPAGLKPFSEELPPLPSFPGFGGCLAPSSAAHAASRATAEDARRRESKVKRKERDGRRSKARSPSSSSSSESSGGGLLRGVGARLLAEADARLLEKTKKNKKSYNSQKNIKRGASPDQRRHTRQRWSSVPEPGAPQRGKAHLHHSTPPPARDDAAQSDPGA